MIMINDDDDYDGRMQYIRSFIISIKISTLIKSHRLYRLSSTSSTPIDSHRLSSTHYIGDKQKKIALPKAQPKHNR
ncbi:hypothetical protein Glove_658g23 [Diversispora epigaea]|uniref:Uncharacterized protein n=1 Tax=Diversispora epigaea TaxID=1348612 RepID=A0A397G9Y5_9GLOM|nr:hypothetical protein Glove_658g23 [Diversispora epigaea]